MYRSLSILIIIVLVLCQSYAQENFPVNGVADQRQGIYLLNNATIVPGNNQTQFVGDILIQEGKIVSVAPNIKEKGAVVVDLTGHFVYPSFIDLYAQYGIDPVKQPVTDGPQLFTNTPGAYSANEAIRSEFKAHEAFKTSAIEAQTWREAGFGAVLTHRIDGIARGTGSFVALADKNEHEVILNETASNHLSIRKGSSTQDYPGSKMGAIALLRQTYFDGQWYAKGQKDVNLSLEGWNKALALPTIIEASNTLDILRVDKIGDEFNKQYLIRGTGNEFQRLDALKATNASLIVPVNYPVAIDAEDPWDAELISIAQLKNWELAPYNLKMLKDKGIPFSITTDKLKNKKDLLKNVRVSVEKGLDEKVALNALTIIPARQIGMSNQVGSIEAGKYANLLVLSHPIFDEKVEIIQNWVIGIPYQINEFKEDNIDGEYVFTIDNEPYRSTLKESDKTPNLTIHLNDTADVKGSINIKDNQISISFAIPEGKYDEGYITLNGWVGNDGKLTGKGRLVNGKKVAWKAVKTQALNEKDEEENEDDIEDEKLDEIGEVIYPLSAYGWKTKPIQQKVLFKNATVWTNESKGILENTDVLIDKGKIVKIGKDLSSKDAILVNAEGKHLTSGIIDEHAHIAIQGGVNEWAKSSSAEVSIGDVINSEDVNIYRQLAGGVVAAQLLHGSANPIGGRSALVKLRWGSLPEEMKIKNADGYIKFALGENVTQSNWRTRANIRYPQTRMGVEQVFIDHFTRAKAYLENTDPNKRIDIELEAIGEILNEERFITCHSYIQSEINMLMKVAEAFDFRVNTFTHILEGYKVADKMKEHGVGASTFADWWGYKYEVKEAIPYNASLLNKMGIVTAINSDDAEMGRRLNQETAKAIKYGGMSEEDAWKMITLNPAILLHLDDRMGSIKNGKDADLVLWSDNPLSIYAKAEQTYVDGIKYFDIEEDEKLRVEVELERARLIQKMLMKKKGGAKTTKVEPTEEKHYHCDDIEHWHGFEE